MVALHGFTLDGTMFAELADTLDRRLIAPDLPGHGAAAGDPPSFDTAVKGVARLITELGAPLPLLGYSMGGRVALLVALEAPRLVEQLILISTAPGIEEDAVRARRRREDEKLATTIERDGVEAFLDGWLSRPLFAGLATRGAEWMAADRLRRRRNTAPGLAAALRGMGQGTMPPVAGRLAELKMPVLVLAGEAAPGEVAMAQALAAAISASTLVIIPGAGHALIGEAPKEVAAAVGRFLART